MSQSNGFFTSPRSLSSPLPYIFLTVLALHLILLQLGAYWHPDPPSPKPKSKVIVQTVRLNPSQPRIQTHSPDQQIAFSSPIPVVQEKIEKMEMPKQEIPEIKEEPLIANNEKKMEDIVIPPKIEEIVPLASFDPIIEEKIDSKPIIVPEPLPVVSEEVLKTTSEKKVESAPVKEETKKPEIKKPEAPKVEAPKPIVKPSPPKKSQKSDQKPIKSTPKKNELEKKQLEEKKKQEDKKLKEKADLEKKRQQEKSEAEKKKQQEIVEQKRKKEAAEAEKKRLQNIEKAEIEKKRQQEIAAAQEVTRQKTQALKENLAKMNETRGKMSAAPSSASLQKTNLPQQLGTLQVEALPFVEGSSQGSWGVKESSYSDEIAFRLKKNLMLPDYGAVKVKLTLDRTGKVIKVEIMQSESKKNKTFIESKIPSIQFPPFGQQFQGMTQNTFVITFQND